MNITIEQLLAIIGGKEIDLYIARLQIEELRKRLSEAEAKLGEKPPQ